MSGLERLRAAGYRDITLHFYFDEGRAAAQFTGTEGRGTYSVEVLFPLDSVPDLDRVLTAVANRQDRINKGGIG